MYKLNVSKKYLPLMEPIIKLVEAEIRNHTAVWPSKFSGELEFFASLLHGLPAAFGNAIRRSFSLIAVVIQSNGNELFHESIKACTIKELDCMFCCISYNCPCLPDLSSLW